MMPYTSVLYIDIDVDKLFPCGARAFSCSGPAIWNSLLEYLRDSSLDDF